MIEKRNRIASLLLYFLLVPTLAMAQNVQHTENKVDLALRSDTRVDPSTLAMSIQIPLTAYPGRAGTGLPVSLKYSSKQWRINYSSADSFGTSFYTETEARFAEFSTAGWTTSIDVPRIEYSGQGPLYDVNGNAICLTCESAPPETEQYYISRITVHLSDGSSHELRKDDLKRNFHYEPYTTGFSGVFYAVDGSRTIFDTSTNKLWLPDGSYYLFGSLANYQGRNEQRATQYVDRNGNTLTYNESARQWTDALGRTIGNPLPLTPVANQDTTYAVNAVGGGTVNYIFKWKSLQDVRTGTDALLDKGGFNCNVFPPVSTGANSLFPSNNHDTICSEGHAFNPVVLSEIVLPNGLSYRFTYNIWAEIDKVYLPTGGYERYEYGYVEPLGHTTFPYNISNRGVVNRFLSVDGATETSPWHYEITSTSPYTVRSTTPDGTRTERVLFTGGSTTYFGFESALAGMTSEERVYAPNNGPMLHRTLNEWATSGPTSGGWSTATRNPRVTKQVQVVLDPNGTVNPITAMTVYDYDADLNVISTKSYDYASVTSSIGQTGTLAQMPANPPLLRTEEVTFLVNDSSITQSIRDAYRARNLIALSTSSRIKSGSTIVAQGSISYDESALLTYTGVTSWTDPGSGVPRGNPTSTSRWLNLNGSTFPSGSYLVTRTQYDQCGNVRKVWDARDTSLSNPSLIDYSSTYQFAYPTTITSSVPDASGQHGSNTALITTAVYDFNTGLLTSTTDANLQTTSYDYADPLKRLKQVSFPDGGRVRYNYSDTPPDLYVQTFADEDATRSIETRKYFDGLGRPSRAFLYDGTVSTPWVVTDTYYDSLGRVSKLSNPYRMSSPSATVPTNCSECTTTTYDTLSRIITVITPDNAQVTTSYSASTTGILGTTTTVTDQAGRQRRTLTDALGRLVRIDEPDKDTGSLGAVTAPVQATSYSYDVLDDLIGVTQGSQTRSFAYDSLKRLTSATNPESGTVSYVYDNNGNLTSKTDARPITITYQYDALNRNYSVNYSNTTIGSPDVPDINQVYDGAVYGKGRVWKSYAGGNETVGSNVDKTTIAEYDTLGRPKIMNQDFKLNGVWGDTDHTYQVSRSYNLAGAVTSQSYPSQHTVTYHYDIAGRLADTDAQNPAFSGNLGVGGTPRTYSKGILYAPAGQLTQEQFGTSSAVYNKRFYNSRQQLAEIRASSTVGATSANLGKILNQYSLQCSGAGCNATDNNGNLRKQEVCIPSISDPDCTGTTRYQQYDYDQLNRLLRVHEPNSDPNIDWQQEFYYDRWGNRTIRQESDKTWGANIPKPNYQVDPSNNNRLTAPTGYSMTYDPAGNVTTDTFSGAGTRIYDAENRMTQPGSANTQYTYNSDGQRVRRKVNGVETWQIYGLDGELLAEYPANASKQNPAKEYGFRNGELLISVDSGNASAPPIFGDDFNDNSLNPSYWTKYYPGTPIVSEQSTQLQVALTANVAGYNGVYSNTTYDLTGRMLQVELPQAVSQAGWCENFLELELDANNYFMIQTGAGNLLMRSRVNGVNDQTSIPFDATAHKIWRIRHDQSANVIYFETSSNDTVWITRKTVTPGFSLTGLRIDLLAGCYGTGNGSPGTVKYDNVKLLSSTAGSTSLTVPNGRFEAPVLGNGNWQYSPTGGSWTFANGGGITGMNSAFTGSPSAAPEGVQVAFIQATGEISQSISGFQANTNYVITFSAAQRTNCCNAGGQDIQVYVDSDWKGTFHPPSNGVYTEYSTSNFTTTAGAHTVKFVGVDPLHTGVTAFIDNVRINGSPKPGYGIEWLLTDQLGTPRMVFDESGTLANVKRHDYLPFGEEIGANVGSRTATQGYSASDGVRQQFTSKERDNETGLDYFGARFYASTHGRFTSADEPFADQFEGDPQTWNLYSYTANNPLARVDEDGRRWFYKTIYDGNGRIINRDVQWVNANEDGSYTSPGEGWVEFIPTSDNPKLYTCADGVFGACNQKAILGENWDGSPSVKLLWTGIAEDKPDHIIGAVDLARNILAIARGAAESFGAWRAARAADRAFIESLTDLTRGEISRDVIGGEQTELLRTLFVKGFPGRGPEQAKAALEALKRGTHQVPQGLTRKTLLAYKVIVQRSIEAGIDKGTQAVRLKIIQEALKKVKS